MANGGPDNHRVVESAPFVSDGQDVALIGRSTLFKQVFRVVDAVACNECVVLIEGESGTGKELIARRIHARSARREGPFIPVNCPAITTSLFESQFYGHVRGAFTGATTDTLGVVRAAEGGTLLLDEVGELPLRLQPKLLRLLQEREVTPVGSARPIPANTRFIASTNRDLSRAVGEGDFRGDLYHRLNIVRIEVPPLRDRSDDIEPLVNYYNDHYAARYGLTPRKFRPYLRSCLRNYSWPGNVRELCAYVERLYAADLPPTPPVPEEYDASSTLRSQPISPAPGRMPQEDRTPLCCTLAEAEARAIRTALEATDHNRTAAARILGIHRSTLLRFLKRFRGSSEEE